MKKHSPKLTKYLVSRWVGGWVGGSSNPKKKPFASNLPTQNPKTPQTKGLSNVMKKTHKYWDVIEITMRW